MNIRKRRISNSICEVITIIVSVIFVIPVLLVLLNAVKPLGEILKSPFALPVHLNTENLFYVIKNMHYLRVLLNTVFVSVVVVTVTTLLAAMAGYKLSRTKSLTSKIITGLLLSSMLVPFQTYMIPVAKIISLLHISDSLIGYIIVQVPLYAPMGIFMYTGFMKNVPLSLEEAARIDGAKPFQIFFRVVFPMLKPVTASIAVLYALWIWNDYALASMMLTGVENRTLTITIYSFFSAFTNRWDYAMAALALSILPITVFYVIMQKYIVSGVTAGAVKG